MREFFSAAIGSCFSWLCAGVCIGALLSCPVAAQERDSIDVSEDAAGRSADSLNVPQSQDADSVAGGFPVTGEVQVADTLSVEESELRAVARALISVDSLRREFQGRQGMVTDSTKAIDDLHAEFKAAVARVIEARGITVEFYVRVVKAARRDPDLRERLAGAVARMREP